MRYWYYNFLYFREERRDNLAVIAKLVSGRGENHGNWYYFNLLYSENKILRKKVEPV